MTALTDVTGFGLLGHLIEVCEGSGVNAQIELDKVPVIAEAEQYRLQGAIPGGTDRNYESYGFKAEGFECQPLSEVQKHILCDPQTSGGLLVAVSEEAEVEFLDLMQANQLDLKTFGQLTERPVDDGKVYVRIV